MVVVVIGVSTTATFPRLASAGVAGSLTAVGATATRPTSSAVGVSGGGSVAVGNSGPDGGPYAAFRWTAAGGTVTLGDFQTGRISGDGSVIVGSQSGSGAVRWTQSTGVVPIGDVGTYASSTNDDGTVVVGSLTGGSNANHAFRWTQSSGVTSLGDLPGGEDSSYATAVSGNGVVVVGFSGSDSGSRDHTEAFRWTPDDGMSGLGDLPGGGLDSRADGVNHDGSIIVGEAASSFGSSEAFVWRQSTGMSGLGFLPNNGDNPSSIAIDLTDDGSVIVGSSSSFATLNQPIDVAGEAFIWTPGAGMTRLWDALLVAGVDPAADGWTLLGSANAVSADGLTVVGQGLQNGEFRGFVAVLPEPTSATLLATAAVGFLRRPRRP